MNDLAPDQTRAVEAAVAWYRGNRRRAYFRLVGPAGTGKTSLARQISADCAGTAVAYVAPTGKAAAVLRAKGCTGATTIHSAIYAPAGERTTAIQALQTEIAALNPAAWNFRRELDRLQTLLAKVKAQPLFSLREPEKAFAGKKPRLVVLDEASMVDDKMFADLASCGVPILALGDPYQLPPVAGHANWQQGRPDAELTTVHRFGDTAPLIDLATALRNGRPAPRWDGTAGQTRNHWTPADLTGYDQVIVGRNATRWQIIDEIRDAHGRIPGTPEPGDRIMCLRNDPELDVVNGQQATVAAALQTEEGWALTVDTDTGRTAWLCDGRGFENQAGQDAAKADRDSDLVAVTFAQAITCHSAQGSQWPRVAVVDEAAVFRQAANSWRYTAATRAERTCLILQPGRMIQRSPVGAAA